MNIFQKAFMGLNLTPGERAFLKIVQSLALTALVAGMFAVYNLLSASPTFDWGKVFYTALGAIILSFLHGLLKYATSQGDPMLEAPLKAVTTKAEQMFRPIITNAYTPPVAGPSWQSTTVAGQQPMEQTTVVPPLPATQVAPYDATQFTVTGVQKVVQQ